MQQRAMPDPFLAQRSRLLALAYRMLGATGEAEEVVQEAWIRWQSADRPAIADPAAWLVTVATRLCLDRLRRGEAARRGYPGPWLPEPWLDEVPAPPERAAPDRRLDRAADLSVAFLLLLERLSAPERAALLLRDAFGAEYGVIATALERSEASCRQLVHRARERLREAGPARQAASPAAHRRLLGAFVAAARSGDAARLTRLLAEDARLLADGGGKARAALNPILGARKVMGFVLGVRRRLPAGLEARPVAFNGQPGLLLLLGGEPWAALGAEVAGGSIQALYLLRNPDKLRVFGPAAVTGEQAGTSLGQRAATPPA